MTEPFLGEVRMMSFNFAPLGWALCGGQLLSISQNSALFSLYGTTFGGNGSTTFALPNLQGRTPIGSSSTVPQGIPSGVESVSLNSTQMPSHSHTFQATTTTANANAPSTTTSFGTATGNNLYNSPASLVAMNPAMVGLAGSSQSHSNLQPTTVINFCVALQGVYPSRP